MKNDMIPDRSAVPRSGSAWRWRTGTVLVCAVLVCAALGGGWVLFHQRFHQGDSAAPPDPSTKKKPAFLELSASDTQLASARELRIRLPVSGSLTALEQATVKSKVAADVRETPIAEGMPVGRGQVVVRLDAADLQGRLATQQAAVDDATARLALSRKNRENTLQLLKQKFISQNAVDTAENSVELAEATLKSAQSQRDIARRAVADAVVRSPIDGIVSKRYVQPGEKAAPDMPLFAVVSLRRLILEAQVPASEIPKVAAGQDVDFAVEGFPGRAFVGKVARINPAAEAGSRAITVYIAVDNADGALRSGMFAKGAITLQAAAPLPLVPVTALRMQNGAPVVYRIEGRTVVAQPVTTGLRNDDEGLVQITQGLTPGSRVLVTRLDGVGPGSQVRLPGDAPKAAVATDGAAVAPASKG